MSNGLWAQLGAAEMIQSCGPEIAEVLTQVDILVAKKREEWDAELKAAVRREADEQRRIHQEKIHHLRADLIKLKEAYIKLEHHHAKRPERYKKLAEERKHKQERAEEEAEKVRLENNELRKRLTAARAENETLEFFVENLETQLKVIENIHLKKEAGEMAIVRDENANLREEIDRLRKKYGDIKRHAAKMSDDMKSEREGIIDSLVRLKTLEAQQADLIDSPRSDHSSGGQVVNRGPPLSPRSQQSLLVLPLPVMNLSNSSNESIADKENIANIQFTEPDEYSEEKDDALVAEMEKRIHHHITNFDAFLETF